MDERELMAGVVDAAEKVLACEPKPETRVARAALALLRQRIHMLRAWQEEGNEADRPRFTRARTCRDCQALIFFAQHLPAADEFSEQVIRWVPLETDPVDAAGVLPEWRWVLTPNAVPGGGPTAQVNYDATGEVYVDHRQTCGNGDGPKKHCPAYDRRWRVNATKVNAGMDNESIRAANDLLALQRRLADNRGHDDS